jgi:hypothetical protein
MIDGARIVNKGRKNRETNIDVKKPYAVVQYSKFMKVIDRSGQYLSFYSVLRKTVQWPKQAVLYLLNCALFNAFFCVQDTKYKRKSKVQELPT